MCLYVRIGNSGVYEHYDYAVYSVTAVTIGTYVNSGVYVHTVSDVTRVTYVNSVIDVAS